MTKFFTSLVAVAAMVFASTANAAIEPAVQAQSYLQISNFKVTKVGGADLVVGADVTDPAADIVVSSVAENSTARANVNGVIDVNPAGVIDVNSAYVQGATITSGTGNNTGSTLAGFNAFLGGLSAPVSFSDVISGGSSILTSPGASVTSMSATAVSNVPSVVDTGSASTSTTSSSVFFTATKDLLVEFNFNALLDILLDNLPAPPGALAASASFRVTVAGTGSNNGTTESLTFVFNPTELNTGSVTNFLTGNVTRTFSGSFGSGPIQLYKDGTYSLTLTQGTTASVSPVVPEPATMVVWGVLFAGAALGYARARRA